ncbi:uncharacterized protein LOC123270991 [Cotesia glomerata]|uniref:uncharacterized protein LOC123270991 n=1 Tax=Cotesia glomerata TaxID=32391 RepID=UPI001D034ABD|nr:uncharacterized protein LOC123270991 [Cotesia glomerata]
MVWCVEGINFQNYIAITSNNDHARRFMWDRVMEGGIETPDNGVHRIDMSENGLDFKSIDRLTDTEDDSNKDKDNSSENETDKEKLSSNDDVLLNNDIQVQEVIKSSSQNRPEIPV